MQECAERGVLLAARSGQSDPGPRTSHPLPPATLTKVLWGQHCHPNSLTDDICIVALGLGRVPADQPSPEVIWPSMKPPTTACPSSSAQLRPSSSDDLDGSLPPPPSMPSTACHICLGSTFPPAPSRPYHFPPPPPVATWLSPIVPKLWPERLWMQLPSHTPFACPLPIMPHNKLRPHHI